MTGDPFVEMWRACIGGGSSRDCERGECNALAACVAEGQSTSARLRSAELEIEGVREELARQAAANEDLQATLAIRSRALAASQQDLTRAERERELMRIQLVGVCEFASAFDPKLRVSYYPARQAVGPCVLCGQPIVRGHWVEPVPDSTTKPQWKHADGVCPDPTPANEN